MKTWIQNGLLYDGNGGKPCHANLVLEGERIEAITTTNPADGALVVDASGKIVTPGFVDTHRHCDIAILEDSHFGELELAQGITTAISGNCGLAPFPSVDSYRTALCDFIEPCLGRAATDMDFYSFQDYSRAVEHANPPVNVGSLIGIGAVKTAIKGYDNTPFTDTEMARAIEYIESAMEQGAYGISMGIMYTPECFSNKQEMISLASAAARHGGILSCHMRGEGDGLVSSVEEILEISRAAGIKLNISHFKATGLSNWNSTIYRAIEVIDRARENGQSVTVDFYPYTAGATTLLSLLPPAYMKNNMGDTLAVLSQKDVRDRLKQDFFRKHQGWDNMVESIGFERVIINSVSKESNQIFSGLSVSDAAVGQGYADCTDFLCDLLADESGKVGIILQSMAQEDVDAVAQLPYAALISDALYGKTDMPHPRLYGTTARFLQDYVLKRRIISLETAVSKMTKLPAERFGILNRGVIAQGNYADINIFSLEEFVDHATFKAPKALCTGMDTVFVNGQPILRGGNLLVGRFGKALRKNNQ